MTTLASTGPLAEAVERSAAPVTVKPPLARLIDARPEVAARLEKDDGLADALVAVLAASRSLTRLVQSDPRCIEVLADLGRRPPVDARSPAALAAWKRLELLRIAARDLTGLDELETVVTGLAELADDVLRAAVDLAEVPARERLAVIAMGKLGGQELNYAARVSLDRTQMQVEDKLVNLSPGMAVTAEIKTGSRRIISYLLSPLVRYKQEVLRER